MGAFGESIREAEVHAHIVVDALLACSEVRRPVVADSQQFGGTITWRSP